MTFALVSFLLTISIPVGGVLLVASAFSEGLR